MLRNRICGSEFFFYLSNISDGLDVGAYVIEFARLHLLAEEVDDDVALFHNPM